MLPETLFRNYDVRGEYGDELTAEAIYIIARAYVRFTGVKQVAIGRDARVSSPELMQAAVRGLTEEGADVFDVGMVATDVLYFATWHSRYDGSIMITASHMPKNFNGMKFLRLDNTGDLSPIGRGIGMEELEDYANRINSAPVAGGGQYQTIDVWDDYVSFVRSFVNLDAIRPLKVVMDAGNGMGGVVADHVFDGIDIDITKLFFTPDGSFPNHDPNPIIPENRQDIIALVRQRQVDLGIAWDADCDRCYFIDEKGEFINGDFITALLAIQFLRQYPGAAIVYDLRSTWAVADWVAKLGGKGLVERVGHTYIKPAMKKAGAVFGGEMSGHYYFAANKYMDNGFIPALMILEIISKAGKPLSEIIADLGDYHVSGEINFTVKDVAATLKAVETHYTDAKIDRLDGLSLSFADWRCNIRPSANDPVLRLNVEAKSAGLLKEKVDEISNIIKPCHLQASIF